MYKSFLLVTLFLVLALFMAGTAFGQVTINALLMSQAGYQESEMRAMTDDFFELNPDINVNLTFVSYEELYSKIVVSAAAGAGTFDVIITDCIWPAEFAEAGWLLDVTDWLSEEDRADIFPEVLSSVTYQGRLYGMPWLNDWQYLFYNRAMLEEVGASGPEYWTDMLDISQKLKENDIVQYPVIDAWGQGEVLVIQWLQYAHAMGGDLFDEDGNMIFAEGEPLEALQFMLDGLEAGIFNPAGIESYYEEVRRVFSSGQAAFTFNWLYMYNLANDPAESQVAGDAVISLIPGFPDGARSATCNGGMGLSIVNTCPYPEAAWTYIQYLTSREVQKKYSESALPIWISLYDDPEMVALQPELIKVAQEQILYVFDRPQVPWYSQFSQIVAEELQAALIGLKAPDQALGDAVARATEVQERYR